MSEKETLFKRLNRLFRSGPLVKRKIRGVEKAPAASSVLDIFKKSQNHIYQSAIASYGSFDRMSRYADFSEMEYNPIISSALDVYADESTAQDDKNQSLHIYSNNPQVQKLLEELFYDTLNIEFNLRPWVRNLCKYGDFFLFNDVSPDYGVQNVFPIAVNEIEREEGYDPKDPLAIRYRWITQGNQVLDNWQITHFRLLGNDAFLPYGSSMIEPARRVFRQLILMEDSMISYRIVRSPERRVFYIDVGNIPPEEVPNYLENAKASLKTNTVIDKGTGKTDLRFNPMSVLDDYFIPVRGSESRTKVETLAGGQNTTAIEDVEYIKNNLFAALKIPKAYLGFDEGIGSKSLLSQEDIKFSRTINMVQRVIVAELTKIASIHLFSHGFEGEELLDFVLHLSNPSTIAQQQKLEIYRTKFEIASSVPDNLVDLNFLRRNVLGMNDDDIQRVNKGLVEDRKFVAKLDHITETKFGEGIGGGGGGGGGLGGGGLGDDLGSDLEGGDEGGAEEDLGGGGEEEAAEDLNAAQDREEEGDEELLVSSDELPIKASKKKNFLSDDDGEEDDFLNEDEDEEPTDGSAFPLKANNIIGKYHYNKKRRRTHGSSKTGMPDFKTTLSHRDRAMTDPFDKNSLGIGSTSFKLGQWGEGKINDDDKVMDEFWLKKEIEHKRMTAELKTTLKHLGNKLGSKIIEKRKNNYVMPQIRDGLLTETIRESEEDEINLDSIGDNNEES